MKNTSLIADSEINKFHLPRWEELPEIDLYLDQVVTLINSCLSPILSFNIDKKENPIVTKTMINNYVKHHAIKPPVNKKYNKEHLAYLFVIFILKQVYSISDIKKLINLAIETSSPKQAYNRFCEELEKVLPKGLNKFLFSDNGSSCIEMALKLSFQYHLQTGNPQKTKFISLQNAYHGETIGALGVGDVDIFTETYRPLIKEGRKVKVPYINENLTADEFKKYEDECFTDLENLVNENHHEIACMIVEPLVQGAAGMMMYSPNYLKRVRELTKKFNIHLIDDEIAMGFGRTGKMFACEHAGIKPDIMCIAKGLSSGYYPIAMVCITTEIFNAFYADYKEGKSFLHSHTYSGNPLGCRIALEILKIFREEQVLNTVNKKGAYLKKQAQKLFKDKPYIKEYRHIGLIGALELKDIAPGERIGRQIYEIALKKGVLIRPIGNIIYFMPPYVITEEEIDTLLKVCLDSIEEFISIKKINLKDTLKSDNKKRENLDSPF